MELELELASTGSRGTRSGSELELQLEVVHPLQRSGTAPRANSPLKIHVGRWRRARVRNLKVSLSCSTSGKCSHVCGAVPLSSSLLCTFRADVVEDRPLPPFTIHKTLESPLIAGWRRVPRGPSPTLQMKVATYIGATGRAPFSRPPSATGQSCLSIGLTGSGAPLAGQRGSPWTARRCCFPTP
jgi:hypothetical protein